METEVYKRVLEICINHYNTYFNTPERCCEFDVAHLSVGDVLPLGDQYVTKATVENISEDSISLKVMEEVFDVGINKTVEGRRWHPWRSDEIQEEIIVTVAYLGMSLNDVITEEFQKIQDIHAVGNASAIDDAKERQRNLIKLIDTQIAKGNLGLYPLKAILMTCDKWHLLTIVRENLFREILAEGIDKGALGPDDDEGWEWLRAAACQNDPAIFMTDMDRYYDLLMTAVEEGNQDAREIMDLIWEPENCQEED